AAQSFQRYHYAQSAELYAQLADRDNPRLQDLEYAAESHYKMRDFAAAEIWYAQAVQHKDHLPQHVLRYADVLKANGKYAEAKSQYRAYAELSGDARAVEIRIAGCDSALLWKLNPTLHTLHNEEEVNTGGSEFSVSVIGDNVYF